MQNNIRGGKEIGKKSRAFVPHLLILKEVKSPGFATCSRNLSIFLPFYGKNLPEYFEKVIILLVETRYSCVFFEI